MDPTILAGLVGAGQNAVSSLLGMADGAINRNFQRKEAEKNRNWQSEEAALQRDWSAAEAERARDWNEEMYEKYNSLSGKISQAEQAGVNPMFAVTGSAVSPVSANASAPSGASAGSVGNPIGMSSSVRGLIDIMANITGIKRQQSEADVNSALAKKYSAEAEGQTITNESLAEMNRAEIMKRLSEVKLNESNIPLVVAKVVNTNASTEQIKADVKRISSQIRNTDADTDVKVKQLELMASQILVNSKSLDEMDASITAMAAGAGLDNAHVVKIHHEVNRLKQEFHHNGRMFDYQETVASFEASMAEAKDPDSYSGINRELRIFLNELKEIFGISLGATQTTLVK